jgi:hypothetical protein
MQDVLVKLSLGSGRYMYRPAGPCMHGPVRAAHVRPDDRSKIGQHMCRSNNICRFAGQAAMD